MQYTYDAQGRVIKETYEDGQSVSYAYDRNGNLARTVDSETGISTTYFYDSINRPSGHRAYAPGSDHIVQYAYDSNNNVTYMTEITNGVSKYFSYTYDDDNRVISMTADGITVEYTYDSLGRVTKQVTKNGSTVISTKNTTYATSPSGKATAQVRSYNGYTYTYDDNGNIISVSDGTNTTSYVYDSANQLVRENNPILNKTYTWVYDGAGNIRERKEYAHTTGALGTPTDTVSYTYGDSQWGDLLTAYDGKTITYDNIGNSLTYDGWTFNWKHGRQLASMTKNGTTWTYTYDANGMRTSRSNGNNTYSYVYNGSQLVQIRSEGTNRAVVNITYDASGRPFTIEDGHALYYYVTNLQGDVIGLADVSGNIEISYTYDAWGNVQMSGSAQIGDQNPLMYRGYVYDRETGLYYLQSRYYNPEWGRFINADAFPSTGQSFTGNNMFAYCGNNPVSRADDGGEFWHLVVGGAVGAVLGAVITGVSSYIENGEVDWKAVGISAVSGAASGVLAATGVGIGGLIAGNAAISMGENATTQVVENGGFNNFDVGDMLIDGVIGAASGAIGGAGKGTKHLVNLGNQTVKRTFNTTVNKGLKAGIREAGKAFAYYGKNTAKYYMDFLRGIPGDFILSVGTTIASSNYMKYQYSRLVGR